MIEKEGPEQHERTPLEQIEALLDSDEALFTILDRKAERMTNETAKYHLNGEKPTETYRLNKEQFERLYDKESPTLVIDLCASFRNSELLGQAAQMLRDDPNNKGSHVNIVYARLDTNSASLVVANQKEGLQSAVRVTHGILIDADGNTYAGEFDEPIHSEVIDTDNMRLLKQCEDLGIQTLNNPVMVEKCHYKEGIEDFAAAASIKSPQRHKVVDYSHVYKKLKRVVIKPGTVNGGGKGVYIYGSSKHPILSTQSFKEHERGWDEIRSIGVSASKTSRAIISDAQAYYSFLEHYGYKPVCEEYIENYPLYNKETGEKHSWSVRHIIGSGELLGTYIRMNTLDEPTNANQGASNLSLEELRTMIADSSAAEAMIKRILKDGEQLAATLDTSVGGVDIIMSENMESYLIEINLGQVGGLNRLTELTPHSQKLKPYKKFIKALHDKHCTNAINIESHQTLYEEKIKRDMIARFKGLYDTGNISAFAALTKDEISTREFGHHFAGWLWIWARLYIHHQTNGSEEEAEAICQDALDLAPLAFIENLDKIVSKHFAPHYFKKTIDNLVAVFDGLLEVHNYIQEESRVKTPNDRI